MPNKPSRWKKARAYLAVPFVVTSLGACAKPPPQEKPETDKPANKTNGWETIKREDGTCWKVFHMDCPEGDKCNPPPPRKVPCPADDGEKKIPSP